MCAANRKIICLDTEYSTNWDSRIIYFYVYDFILETEYNTNWDSRIIYFYVYNFILESFMFIPFMFYVWDSRINIYLPLMMPVYRFDLLVFCVFLCVCIYSEYKMMTIEMKNCVVFPNGL